MKDFREEYDGEKTLIKLTKENVASLLQGKILKGFKTKVGIVE